MGRLNVEVVFAMPDAEDRVQLAMESGVRAIDAVRASGLQDRQPEIDMRNPKIGIFGDSVSPDTLLRNGDRVEVYRPLRFDPKELRRAKAKSDRRRDRK